MKHACHDVLWDVVAVPSQRKQQRDLLAALQKVVVPIYCTSFLSVEEDKQQKITRVTQYKSCL